MNEARPMGSDDQRGSGPVFISFATADRKQALNVCKAIERRGPKCWISGRDVAPGENYQEAIVRSIRTARAVVLIFSQAANNSEEIKKELSLASRFQVPVMALRLEDVEPSDAFAYELSTRQWIDAFDGWDRSIDSLVRRIGEVADPALAALPASPVGGGSTSRSPRSIALAASALLLVLIVVAGAWWWLRPAPVAAHSMTVRLSGFQLLSADLPETMRDTVNAEIVAAFNADGAVGVSTASAAAPGDAPAYALGGTIQRDGPAIRVITRLTNERSGATLWSGNLNYDGAEAAKVPHHVAVDAGNVVRCGLFGASTYRKSLPDSVLRDYLQFCQGHWDPNIQDGRKALVPAQRVVAAVPDFSWGWAGVAGAFWKVAMSADDNSIADQARASGRQAADRAVSLDSRNSEALWIKSLLIDRQDWIGREDLLKRAIAARRLDCGCEHHQYGEMLLKVGRVNEAVDQLRQADDMLALYVYTPLSLATALVAAGKLDEAKGYFEAAEALASNADLATWIQQLEATATGNTDSILDPKLPLSPGLRAALVKGYRARSSQNADAKAAAVKVLVALPQDEQNDAVASLLADLGANHEAFEIAARLAPHVYPGPSLFFYRSMRGTLNEPGFPALAAQLGLINYWKATRTKPDVCNERGPPAFCRMI